MSEAEGEKWGISLFRGHHSFTQHHNINLPYQALKENTSGSCFSKCRTCFQLSHMHHYLYFPPTIIYPNSRPFLSNAKYGTLTSYLTLGSSFL
jgi:hypothetical protein